jgi:predicted DNA-binding ribbon-helix-helix protein
MSIGSSTPVLRWWLGVSAKTRYIERNYKKVKVKKVFWVELRRLADERGVSIPELLFELYRHYITCNCRSHSNATA